MNNPLLNFRIIHTLRKERKRSYERNGIINYPKHPNQSYSKHPNQSYLRK